MTRLQVLPTKSTVFSIVLGLCFLTPVSTIGNLLMPGLIILTYLFYRPKNKYLHYQIALFVVLLLSFCLNSLTMRYLGFKSVSRSATMFLLFALFPYINENFDMSPKIPILLIGVVFLSQLSEVLNIQPIMSLIDNLYPWENALYGETGVEFNLGMAGRYGGIYRNPNDCGRTLCILTSLYLVCSHYNKLLRTAKGNALFDCVVFATAVTAVVTTGSRTNMVIIAVLILSTLFVRYNSKSNLNKIILLSFVLIIMAVTFTFLSSSGSRLFEVSFTANERRDLFGDLLLDLFGKPIHLLFGYFYIETIDSHNLGFEGGFDSDLGNILYYYGFTGLLVIALFVIRIYKNTGKIFFYVLPLFLTCVSNGLFTSYKALCHLMILMAVCWCVNKNEVCSNIGKY